MSKEQGYKETRHKIVVEMAEHLRERKTNVRDFCRILREHYLTTDKTANSFYQRIYKLLQGDHLEPFPEELEAFRRYIHAENNIHQYAGTLNAIPNLEKKIIQLGKYLDSSYVNKVEAKKILTALKTLIPLSNAAIQQNDQ